MSDQSELPLEMPQLARVTVPFTGVQQASLNDFQISGTWHPYTCPLDHDWCDEPEHILNVLNEEGFTCSCTGCGYTQDWAYAYTVDWSWSRQVPAALIPVGRPGMMQR